MCSFFFLLSRHLTNFGVVKLFLFIFTKFIFTTITFINDVSEHDAMRRIVLFMWKIASTWHRSTDEKLEQNIVVLYSRKLNRVLNKTHATEAKMSSSLQHFRAVYVSNAIYSTWDIDFLGRIHYSKSWREFAGFLGALCFGTSDLLSFTYKDKISNLLIINPIAQASCGLWLLKNRTKPWRKLTFMPPNFSRIYIW